MSAHYELPDLGGSLQQAHSEPSERPGRQLDAIPRFGALRPVKSLASAFRRLAGGISRWRRRRSSIRELQALSAHHLADIGLDRSQIVSTVEALIEARDRPA